MWQSLTKKLRSNPSSSPNRWKHKKQKSLDIESSDESEIGRSPILRNLDKEHHGNRLSVPVEFLSSDFDADIKRSYYGSGSTISDDDSLDGHTTSVDSRDWAPSSLPPYLKGFLTKHSSLPASPLTSPSTQRKKSLVGKSSHSLDEDLPAKEPEKDQDGEDSHPEDTSSIDAQHTRIKRAKIKASQSFKGLLSRNRRSGIEFDTSLVLDRHTDDLDLIVTLGSLDIDNEFEVQRVPDYDVFLSRLLEETNPSHPDYDELSRAAARVRIMVEEREEEVKHAQNDQKMDAVQERFPNDDLQLVDRDRKTNKSSVRRRSGTGGVILKSLGRKHHPGEKNGTSPSHLPVPDFTDAPTSPQSVPIHCNHSNRIYVLEGPVQFTTSCQTQDRYLFLFNDILLVAKQRSNNIFKLKHRVRVCEIWLSDCINDVAETVRPPDRSFVLGWPTMNCVATFNSASFMAVWREKLTSQVKLEKSKEDKTCVVKIRYMDPDSNCQSMKSMNVSNGESVSSLVYRCVEEFHILGREASEYQLWASSTTKDEPPYPLFGHEHPYSIRKSQERDWVQEGGADPRLDGADPRLDSLRGLDLSYFTLQTAKKKPRDLSLDETKRNKKIKKSPLHNIFKRAKPPPAAPSGKLFGHSLTTVTDDNTLPEPIKVLLVYLFQEGLFTVGVFRKPGSMKKCQEIISKIDSGEELDTKELSIPVAASVLKDYLKNLPNCLLCCELCDQWFAMSQLGDATQRLNQARKLVEALPKCHQTLLRHLVCLLYLVSYCQTTKEQGMDSYALSICISQVLLWPVCTKDAMSSQALLQAEATASKVVPVVQFLIDNFQSIFGEECIRLFGALPVEGGKPRQDSSTDSDSMHSLLSLPEQQCIGNRDNSSLDSLDRDCYEMDASPQLVKSHLSPTNLSRDSGLTLSDTQLYEDGTESEHSSIAPRKQPITRSYSQFDDSKPSADPGLLSSSHDGSLNTMNRTGPVAPPRKAKRRSAGLELEAALNKTQQNVPQLRGSASSHCISEHKRNRNMFASKRMSDDSTLGSLDEEYPVQHLEELNVQHYKNLTDMGTIRKSESGAHLYINDDLVATHTNTGPQRTVSKEHGRLGPPGMAGSEPVEVSRSGARFSRRSDINKLGGSLDFSIGSSPNLPIPENQVLSFSSTFAGDCLSKTQPVFSLSPPESPDRKLDNGDSNQFASGIVAMNQPVLQTNVETPPPRPPIPRDYSPTTLSTDEQAPDSASSKVQMRAKSSTSVGSFDRGRKAKLMRGDAIDSTVLPKTKSVMQPVDDMSQASNNEDDGKLRKGMTASGADKFPATIPLRTSLYSLDDVTIPRNISNDGAQTQQLTKASHGFISNSPCRRSDSYSGGVPSSVDRFRQRTIEKSASDTSVSDQFELSGPVRATGRSRSRPREPPTYEEAIQRKTQTVKQGSDQIVAKDMIVVQQTNSAKAKKLYEESLKKYEDTSDIPACCSPHKYKEDSPSRQHPEVLGHQAKSFPPPYEQDYHRSGQSKVHKEHVASHLSPTRKPLSTYCKQHNQSESPPRKVIEHVSRAREPSHRMSPDRHHDTMRKPAELVESPLRHHGGIKEDLRHDQRLNAKQRDSRSKERAYTQPRLSTPPSSRAQPLTESPVRHEHQLTEVTVIQDRHQNLLDRHIHAPDRHQNILRQSPESVGKENNSSRSSSFSSRESTPSRTRESTPSRTSPASRSDSDRSKRRENRRPASRSRERRPGQRYSDPKMSCTKAAMTNISRSKSDSQDHLDKVSKYKQLTTFDNNKENVSVEDMRKGNRSGRSTPQRKSSDDRIKSHSEERKHRQSVPESVLKAAVTDIQRRSEKSGSHERRLSVPSVRNKDWHRELASQYKESDLFYMPQSENRHNTNLVQFGYSTNKTDKYKEADKPKRWTPPRHPTKDLIYVTKEEHKGHTKVTQGHTSQPADQANKSNAILRHNSGASSRGSGSSQPDRRAGEGRHPRDRPVSLWTDDLNKLEEQYITSSNSTSKAGSNQPSNHKQNNTGNNVTSCHQPNPHVVDGIHSSKATDGFNWSVAKLRGLYADQKASEKHHKASNSATQNKSTKATNSHFYTPGSQPPAPVVRPNAPWRSTRTANERTNPNADEAYI